MGWKTQHSTVNSEKNSSWFAHPENEKVAPKPAKAAVKAPASKPVEKKEASAPKQAAAQQEAIPQGVIGTGEGPVQYGGYMGHSAYDAMTGSVEGEYNNVTLKPATSLP